MMKTEAQALYNSLLQGGSHPFRDNFFNSLEDMELGMVGNIAKRLNKEMDGEFILGVDFGILIALDIVFGLRE